MRHFLTILLALSLAAPLLAQSVLDPRTYRSPSGKLALFVDPSAPDGSGPATYQLTRSGKPVWSRTYPFTLWEAVVTDDGRIAGYGYTAGYHGRAGRDQENAVIVAFIDKNGLVFAEDRHPRQHPNFRSNPPSPTEPLGLGITLDVPDDRVLIRAGTLSFGNENPFRWWIYRITTGERIAALEPDIPDRNAGFIKEINAELVPGTPLVLVHWYRYIRGGGAASFSLLNEQGKELWKLDIDDEYAARPERFNWSDLAKEPPQISVSDAGFEIHSHARDQRLGYHVQKQDNGWIVTAGEANPAPKPEQELAAKDAAKPVARIELKLLGEVELQTGAEGPHPVRSVYDFAIDAQGRLGFLRRHEDDRRLDLVIVSPQGQVLKELPIPEVGGERPHMQHAYPLGNDAWLLIATGLGEQKAGVWRLDASSGQLQRFDGITFEGIRESACGPGGTFALLGGGDWVRSNTMAVYGSDGNQRWQRDVGRAEAIAISTGGRIAVLYNIQNVIQLWSAEGEKLQTIELAKVLGRKPNYPSGLQPDLDDGWILHDFNSPTPIYRLDAEGKVTSRVRPRWKDGRTFRLYGMVQVAPDGSLWTSDAHRLLRLGEDGIVEQVIGEDVQSQRLDSIRAAAIGPDGRIYAIAEGTNAVHIFDRRGQSLGVLTPDPKDFPIASGLGHITVSHDSQVFYYPQSNMGISSGLRYLQFDADGNRVGTIRAHFDSISEEWHCQPAAPLKWALGMHEIRLLDEKGETIKRIQRRPDNGWLRSIDEGAVAADGSLAVLTSGNYMMRDSGSPYLSTYAADGEPRHAIPIEPGGFRRIAFDGRYAIVTHIADTLRIYDTTTGENREAALPREDQEAYWYLYCGPDRELWARRSGSKTFLRFAMPQWGEPVEEK